MQKHVNECLKMRFLNFLFLNDFYIELISRKNDNSFLIFALRVGHGDVCP